MQRTPKHPVDCRSASQMEPLMNTMYKPNISATEKWVSTIAGAALAVAGYKRHNNLLGLAGLGLIGRGISGICPVNMAIGRNTASRDTREALGGSRGVIVESSVTIYRPAQEIYSYWRQFENLPRFMYHLEQVQDLGCNRSRWAAKGPLGSTVSWEAEIIRDVPPELISWRTLPDADVVSAGSVWFKPAGGDHGTEVRVKLQYDPPAGKVGASVAWLLSEDAQQKIDDDLHRFKQLMETGEISTGARYRSPRQWREREDRAASQIMSEPYATR
jgi:uncharacterized membrane protein